MSTIIADYKLDISFIPEDGDIQWDVVDGSATIEDGQGTAKISVKTDSEETETFTLSCTVTKADGQSTVYTKEFTHERVTFDSTQVDPFGRDRDGILYRFEDDLIPIKTGWFEDSGYSGELTPTDGEEYYECAQGQKAIQCGNTKAYYCDRIASADNWNSSYVIHSYIFSIDDVAQSDGKELYIAGVVKQTEYNNSNCNIIGAANVFIKDRKLYFTGTITLHNGTATVYSSLTPSDVQTAPQGNINLYDYNLLASSEELQDNTIYHITIFTSRDDDKVYCYVNGELKSYITFIHNDPDGYITTGFSTTGSYYYSSVVGGYNLDGDGSEGDEVIISPIKVKNLRLLGYDDIVIYKEEAELMYLEAEGCEL